MNKYYNYNCYKSYTKRQKGQVILLLILVMTVALAIGLSIVQKSLVDVSTSSKVEQSSRAYSAAEAGIEKALQGDSSPLVNFTESAGITEIKDTKASPCVPADAGCDQTAGEIQLALEYPPLAREDVVQAWLADYKSLSNPPPAFYDPPSPPEARTLDVFWGDPAKDRAALELTLVYYDGTKYASRKWFLDNAIETRSNGFDKVNCIETQLRENKYTCKKTLGNGAGVNNGPLPSGLMLIRARLLYNNAAQPFAVGAAGRCGRACSIPPQSRTIISTGVSGETQRKVKLYQYFNVVPPYFDYAIFSAGPITK